jgi:hypothetical protein
VKTFDIVIGHQFQSILSFGHYKSVIKLFCMGCPMFYVLILALARTVVKGRSYQLNLHHQPDWVKRGSEAGIIIKCPLYGLSPVLLPAHGSRRRKDPDQLYFQSPTLQRAEMGSSRHLKVL